jgi:hypothetical protein
MEPPYTRILEDYLDGVCADDYDDYDYDNNNNNTGKQFFT